MLEPVLLTSVCASSSGVVARPLVAGTGDADAELYTLSETGRAVWDLLDDARPLGDVAAALGERFEAAPEQLEADVLGFAGELVRRGILTVRS